MKQLQKLCLSAVVMVGVSGFAMIITPRVSAADLNLVVHIGPEAAPAGVVYHYQYYPDEEVYYVPETHIYWWAVDGAWHSGQRVPDGIKLGANVKLDVDGRDPWTHHDVIVAKYPHHKHDDRH